MKKGIGVLVFALLTLVLFEGVLLCPTSAAPQLTPTPSPTPTASNPFADNPPVPVSCGAQVHDTTVGAPANVDVYTPCRPYWRETGPERVYSLFLGSAQPLTVTLITEDPNVDLDLFLLTELSPDACVAAGNTYLRPGEQGMPQVLEPGPYYIVVDGFEGSQGEYTLSVECPLGPFATPTPTPTATPTPTVTPTATPTPTPTATPTPTPTPLPYRQIYVPLTWHRYPDPQARTVQVTLQEGYGYTGTRDTYISRWNPDRTFGQLSWFSVRTHGIMKGLLYFDLGTLPEGAELIKAELVLNKVLQTNANPMTLEAHRLLRPWSETDATWEQASSSTPWAAPGGQPGVDYYPPVGGRVTLSSDVEWVHLDITPIVHAWIADGQPNYGLILVGEGEGSVEYRFAAHEHATVARRPQLILTYRLPSP